MIPERLRNFSFVLCDDQKRPIQKKWTEKIIKVDNPELVAHIKEGKNYGVICGDKSFIEKDGKTYFLIVVDFDNKEKMEKILPLLPETFTTTSGSPKNCVHLWFASDNEQSFKIHDKSMNTICDVQGTGKQIIAPGSKHHSGSTYKVVKDIDFAFITYAELKAILMPFDEKPVPVRKERKNTVIKNGGTDLISLMTSKISMSRILNEIGIDASKHPTNCFAHDSVGGKCFSFNEDTCHCFHCDGSWNKYSLIRTAKGYTEKETTEWFAKESGMLDELYNSRKTFIEEKKKETIEIKKSEQEIAKKRNKEEIQQIISRGLNPASVQQNVEMLYKINPFCYTRGEFFYFWDNLNYKWIDSDATDVMCAIDTQLGISGFTNSSKITAEYMNAFKRVGRTRIPKEVPMEFVQFTNTIYNLKTGEEIEATSDYFLINSIPHKVSKDEATPEIDRILKEWVGEKYVITAKQILAYCCLNDYPINRIFVFTGGGSNGKSTFLQLIENFIGKDNICSTSLDQLTENRFEAYNLYGKKVACIGETNFGLLQKTELIKRLSGRDTITFEAKNKGAFFGKNTAKLIISSNSLPTSDDTSDGFYRRFLILDFPNQFSEKSNILDRIPAEEYSNLARWCINHLPELLMKGGFEHEGDIQERKQKYIMASNPLPIFIEKYCVVNHDDHSFWVPHSKLYTEYVKMLVEQKRRVIKRNEFSKAMTEMGFELVKTTKYFGNNETFAGYLYTGIQLCGEKAQKNAENNDINDVNDVNCTRCLTREKRVETTSLTSLTSLKQIFDNSSSKTKTEVELTGMIGTENIKFCLRQGYLEVVKPGIYQLAGRTE